MIDELVRLPDPVWTAVEPGAVALLGKVRGDARAALTSVFERRGVAWRARSRPKHADPVLRARTARPGAWAAIRRGTQVWGVMHRTGFGGEGTAVRAAPSRVDARREASR